MVKITKDDLGDGNYGIWSSEGRFSVYCMNQKSLKQLVYVDIVI